MTGLVADSLPPYLAGNIFLKYDLDGNLLFAKTLRSNSKTYETWLGDLIPTPDGNFLDIGFTIDSTRKALLIKYSPTGDTLFTKENFSYYYPLSSFIVPEQIVMMPDKELYILNNVEKPGTVDNDFSIMKLDSNANMVWQKIYGSTWREVPKSMVLDNDGGLIIGASIVKLVTQNFVNRTYIIKIDTAGVIEWEYLTPVNVLLDAARDMVRTNDGGLVIASGKGIEEPVNATTSLLSWESGYIFKLNANRQFVWGVEVKDSIDPSSVNYFSKLISVGNEGAFVATGQFLELPTEFSRDIFGWLVKVSADGEQLWLRKHHIVESDLDWHTVYDLKQTPDGGFIMVGQARDSEADTLRQQGWIIKLDSFGCLVPGCQLIDDTEEAKEEGTLLLYPNPAKDYLNFFYRLANISQKTTFRIYDAQGRLMKQFDGQSGEMTYILPVWDWAAGVYFLQVEAEGVVVRTERFVVQR
jgi:hypothetical protein